MAFSAGNTWYVDDDSTCVNGCGSASAPFSEIQAAIDSSIVVDGDTILVQPGAYGQVDFKGKAIEIRSSAGSGQTAIVVSGGTFGTGSAVSFVTGEGPSSILDGFAITGGFGTLHSSSQWSGGGVFCIGSSPVIQNCRIYGNHITGLFESQGAGVYCDMPVSIEGCVIEDNWIWAEDGADHGGAGVWGPAVLTDCVILNNTVTSNGFGCGGGGGGVAGATLFSCQVIGNEVWSTEYAGSCTNAQWGFGGGVRDSDLHDCIVANNRVVMVVPDPVIPGNHAPGVLGAGGGAYASSAQGSHFIRNSVTKSGPGPFLGCGGSPTVELTGGGLCNADLGGCGASQFLVSGCTFEDNFVGRASPGETSSAGGARASLDGCILFKNSAEHFGAGMAPTVSACTIYGNMSILGAAGLDAGTVMDSILWGNSPAELIPGSAQVSFSNIQGGYAGTGVLNLDPLFWDAEGGDFSLLPGSPCIDTGDPSSPRDPDGSKADIGAIPYDLSYCGTPRTYCTAKLNSQGCFPAISWSGSPSATGSDEFFVIAHEVISNRPGIMIWGLGAMAMPFQAGTLCVAAPQRTGVQDSGGNLPPEDCSGTFSFHFDQSYLASSQLVWGTVVHAQYWYRDPADTTGFGSGLTDAVKFIVCP